MINKDRGGGGNFSILWGDTAVMRGDIELTPQSPPTRENPVGRGLLFDFSVQVGIKDFLLQELKKKQQKKNHNYT